MPVEQRKPRMTLATKLVLRELVRNHQHDRYVFGGGVAHETHLAPGTVSVIFDRLKTHGWVRDRWETEAASQLNRPKRRYYQLTEFGLAKAREALGDEGADE